MKLRPFLALVPAVLVPFAALHCSNGAAPHPIDAGPAPTGTGVPPTIDGGPSTTGFYSPQNCPYKIGQETNRPFTDYALDDATQPSDPATATPLRVRVGLNGGTTAGASDYADPTKTAAFRWETAAATTNARVKWGTSATALSNVQTGYVFTSPPPSAGLGADEPPVYFHEVDVCGLTPGTTYYYQVGGGAAGQEIWSATQSFTTVPAAGSGKIVVGVYGDARDTVATWQMVNQRMVGEANLLLVSGDIVDIGVDESLFAQWLSAIWGGDDGGTSFITLGQIPFIPIAGNHENEASQFFGNFPLPGSGPYAGTYSSFNVGNTHFVMFDDQQIAEAPSSAQAAAQLAWLDADLKAADAARASQPFVVAISHRGIYSTSYHATDPDVLQTRGSLAPIFDKYHVTLVLNGHDHEYERSLPIQAGSPPTGAPTIVDGGTTYVINAGAGADPYPIGSYTPSPDYRAGNATALGSLSTKGYIGCYVLLTLEGTTLTLNSYGMKASGGSVAGDDVIDTVTFGQ